MLQNNPFSLQLFQNYSKCIKEIFIENSEDCANNFESTVPNASCQDFSTSIFNRNIVFSTQQS